MIIPSDFLMIERYSHVSDDWKPISTCDNLEKGKTQIMAIGQSYPSPNFSRFRIKDETNDMILHDTIITRREAVEGEEAAMFNIQPENSFLRIVFSWHNVH